MGKCGTGRAKRQSIKYSTKQKNARSESSERFANFGRGERIRTSDLFNPIEARYRAALRPDNLFDSPGV